MPLVSFVLGTLSTSLFVASLWQLELITGWDQDQTWDAPFFLFSLSKWVARDLFYTVNILSLILFGASCYLLAAGA